VHSGRFNEEQIRIHTVPLNLFIHQYLEVNVGQAWRAVDPWSAFLQIPFGKHAAFFG
jgi:hypothetical protein